MTPVEFFPAWEYAAAGKEYRGVQVLPVSNDRVLDIISHSVAQTQRLGARLGELARAGDVYCLEGDLGTGKTSFVQGLGKGLGVIEPIHSPTFILANEHRSGRLPLFHVDVYRVRGSDEAVGFGLDDYLSDEGVCVIEWAEKIRSALPSEHLWLAFRHLGESKRGLLIQANGSRYEELLNEFKESVFAFKSARDMDASDPNTVDPHDHLRGARRAAGD